MSASSASLSRWLCSGPGNGTVIPGRIGSGMSSAPLGGPVGRWIIFPEPDDAALTGRREQRAVLREHVHEAVPETALHGVRTDVEQHPLGRAKMHDPQRVV